MCREMGPRNTSVPCHKTKTYATVDDWQTEIDVKVFEGERACTDGNNLLGEFHINGIQRARKGEAQVDVTFALDANGILSVTARDKVTGAKADIKIQGRNQLSSSDVERMVADAEANRREDERFRAEADEWEDGGVQEVDGAGE